LFILVRAFDVQSPSDGRRAPVAREIKLRSSVLTQTPPISSMSDNRGSPFLLVSADSTDGFVDFGSKEDITSGNIVFISHSLTVSQCIHLVVYMHEITETICCC